ncbi:MAG: lytic transglycosylase domain-containing protein [Acidobacteria bacterium]|nr:lytic transglycosylase domain-containing protein [Acidobacteriota bacterium]MCI0719148.1 lytic transglycosylase domain-containing protein [Acidobacteriota bacterium]
MANLKPSGSTMICPEKNPVHDRKSWILLGLALGLSAPGNLLAFDQGLSQLKQTNPDFIRSELKLIVDEFGSDAERIPADFLEKVRRWARLYQTRDRSDMARMLGSEREIYEAVRQQLQEAQLPPDLAFITLVESEFKPKVRSQGNNAGLWQFEPTTARLNGLRVNAKVDERLDPKKSTAAACRYISALRQILGPDTSLLIMVAAYNLGPSRLQARMKTIGDPGRRKDFWHLYSTRLIPALTRTHIARLMAAILIGRHEKRFGFGTSYRPAVPDRSSLRNPKSLGFTKPACRGLEKNPG